MVWQGWNNDDAAIEYKYISCKNSWNDKNFVVEYSINGRETFFCLNCDDRVKLKTRVHDVNCALYDKSGNLKLDVRWNTENDNISNDGSKFYCMLLSWPVTSNQLTIVLHFIVTHVIVLWYMPNTDTDTGTEVLFISKVMFSIAWAYSWWEL